MLAPLDSFQDRFLSKIRVSDADALLHFNLAPLRCRRDIAMLGLIHRCVLRKGPDHFKTFFQISTNQARNTRSGSARHGRQIIDIRNRRFLEMERRNALGLIWIYNRLPEAIVSNDSVKEFQRHLQLFIKQRLSSGDPDWKHLLSPRIAVYRHPLR